jgi:ABC-type molybdate transport system ATPase subunit
VIPAVVRRCERVADGVLVHVDAGEPLVAKLTAGAARDLGLQAGVHVHLVIKAQALRRLA